MTHSNSITGWINRRPCFSYFALAYAWSWGAWFLAACSPESSAGRTTLYTGVFGPALAAAVVTKVKHGSLGDWLSGLVRWRVPLRWYLFVLGLPVLFSLTVSAQYALLGNPIDLSLLAARLPGYLPMLAFTMFFGGGNEEPGWRGIALPRLQSRFGPIRGTLVLGLAWALWHLPLIAAAPSVRHGFTSGTGLALTAFVTLCSIVGYAFWYTWLYNRTRSLLLCILFHAGINTANSLWILLPNAESHGAAYRTLLLISAGTLLVSVALLVAGTRGQLGWRMAEGEPFKG